MAGHPLRRTLRHAFYTHIDDGKKAESLQLSPRWGSASPGCPEAVPDPQDRLFLGSEGTLIITEAWMRLQHRPAMAVTVRGRLTVGAAAATDDRQAGCTAGQLPACWIRQALLNAGASVGGGLLVLASGVCRPQIDRGCTGPVAITAEHGGT